MLNLAEVKTFTSRKQKTFVLRQALRRSPLDRMTFFLFSPVLNYVEQAIVVGVCAEQTHKH